MSFDGKRIVCNVNVTYCRTDHSRLPAICFAAMVGFNHRRSTQINFWAGLISSIFYVFATQQRFLTSVQLLVTNELFHQSSFYWENIVLSFQLLFQQHYMRFSPVEEVRGEMSQTHNYTRRVRIADNRTGSDFDPHGIEYFICVCKLMSKMMSQQQISTDLHVRLGSKSCLLLRK